MRTKKIAQEHLGQGSLACNSALCDGFAIQRSSQLLPRIITAGYRNSQPAR